MKKVFGILLITVLSISAVSAQSSTYVQGGVNLANITKTNDGQTEDNNILTTFNVGVMHRFGLSPVVDLESGLLFMGKGAKAETYFSNGNYTKSTFHPLYFEVPLNVLVKFPIGGGANVFANAGPYAAIGIGGKSKRETQLGPIVTNSESNIKFTSTDPNVDDASYDKLKRFDFGLNFGGGVSFKHFILKANYGLGLTKINSKQTDNDANDKNKYRTVSFSVGIPLGR